jgi:hypothetical protein
MKFTIIFIMLASILSKGEQDRDQELNPLIKSLNVKLGETVPIAGGEISFTKINNCQFYNSEDVRSLLSLINCQVEYKSNDFGNGIVNAFVTSLFTFSYQSTKELLTLIAVMTIVWQLSVIAKSKRTKLTEPLISVILGNLFHSRSIMKVFPLMLIAGGRLYSRNLNMTVTD